MANKNPSLTICIPTYNRPEKIRKTIINLSVMKNIDHVKILIIDNCSPVPVLEIYNKLDVKLTGLKIMRNPINIGIAANIMRSIEYAETDWVWLLSDDDIALKNSLEIIIEDLCQIESSSYSTVLLKYSTRLMSDSSSIGTINQQVYIKTLNELFSVFEESEFFPSFLFMSSQVINKNLFLRYYIKALANPRICNIYPVFPLLVNNQAGVYISDKMICRCGTLGKWPSDTWFPGIVYRDMLKEFKSFYFISSRNLRTIAHKWLYLKLKSILVICGILSIHGFEKGFIRHLFRDYYDLIFPKTLRFILFPVYFLFLFMIHHHKLLNRLMKYYKKYNEIKDSVINIDY
ncbi:glycosyl transferase [Spirochaetia bacterium]|nr:glycosyl transferase [Spirochaetia bacterium]